MAINLEKGQRINLAKSNGEQLQQVCVGINWGVIVKKGLFGSKKVAVDLDASCCVYDEQKNILDTISFRKLSSSDQAIKHSGDDLTGDLDGDDGLDNEVITVNLTKINPNAHSIGFFINSFQGQDFQDIPFASIRIYEGSPSHVKEVLAKYDVANDASFAGRVSMVLGVMYKRNNDWKFTAIGAPTNDKKLEQTAQTIQQNYL